MLSKLFTLSLLFLAISFINAKPSSSQAPNLPPCGKYEKEVKNSEGETRCIPKRDSCVGSTDFVNVNCFASPCTAFQNSCPQAKKCYTDACNACKAYVYDDLYNKLPCKPASSL